MWKSKQQKAVGSRQKAEDRRVVCLLLAAFCLLAFAGCRRDMQDQPKMKPYRSSSFFPDGLSSRPPVEGTIARGFLKTDVELFTGKKPGAGVTRPSQPAPVSSRTTSAGTTPQGAAAYPDDVETFPISITREVLTHGKERYEIFCTVCHGLTGYGDGMVVRRGFRRAPSFHDDRLRQAPVGHFFDVVTNGWGAMSGYAPQIPVQDRWAIIAYVRALQLSQTNLQSPITTGPPNPRQQSGGHQK